MNNVTLFAIGIMQQRNVRAAVGVVFNRRNLGRHPFFIAAEIHLAVGFLVSTAAVPYNNVAMAVAAARALFGLNQGLFRRLLGDMTLVQDGHKPPRRRIRIKALPAHPCLLASCCVLNFFASWLSQAAILPRCYKFSEYSIIFSPSASFTYAFFQSRRYPSSWPRRRILPTKCAVRTST